MSKPALVVLAAGIGSRYGGLKQLAAVDAAGNSILDYSVYDALRAGFARVVFVIRRDIEAVFRESVGARFEGSAEIAYAFQELTAIPEGFTAPQGRTKPWGTLQATLVGAAQVEGPFAVINADDFYGAESYRVLAKHLCGGAESAMVGFPLRNTLSKFGPVSRGLCTVREDGLLESTTELTKILPEGADARSIGEGAEVSLRGDAIVSMNMWGFTQDVVPSLQDEFVAFLTKNAQELKTEAYLPTAVNDLMSREALRVRVLRTTSAWAGITYPEDLSLVREHIAALTRAGEYPERLWA